MRGVGALIQEWSLNLILLTSYSYQFEKSYARDILKVFLQFIRFSLYYILIKAIFIKSVYQMS